MATLTMVTWISNGSMYHRYSNTKISKATVPLKDLVMVTSSFHLNEKFVMFILLQKTQNCDLDFIISGANFIYFLMDCFILTLNFFFLFHHDSHTYVWSEQERRGVQPFLKSLARTISNRHPSWKHQKQLTKSNSLFVRRINSKKTKNTCFLGLGYCLWS